MPAVKWFCHDFAWSGAAGPGRWGLAVMAAEVLIGIAMLAGTVALLVWAVRRTGTASTRVPSAGATLDELQLLYARGLIGREQYYERLSVLRGKSP